VPEFKQGEELTPPGDLEVLAGRLKVGGWGHTREGFGFRFVVYFELQKLASLGCLPYCKWRGIDKDLRTRGIPSNQFPDRAVQSFHRNPIYFSSFQVAFSKMKFD
jgi:hypothetical protein